MTDLNYENRFIDKIFTEFEQKLFRVFGFGYAELEVVLNREPEEDLEGNNVTDNFAEAFKNGGPAELRWEMNNTIACLEYIYMCQRLERHATYEEWANHIESLNIGFCREDLAFFDVKMFEDNRSDAITVASKTSQE